MFDTPTEVHVHPDNDDKDHKLNRRCWCKPTEDPPQSEGAAPVIVHHAADGRELVENELQELLANDKTWNVTRV